MQEVVCVPILKLHIILNAIYKLRNKHVINSVAYKSGDVIYLIKLYVVPVCLHYLQVCLLLCQSHICIITFS